jgi:hypothetical protein
VASPDLAQYCTPFCTTTVHENDFVCTLSLGLLHDLKDMALAMQDEPTLVQEVVARVTGLGGLHTRILLPLMEEQQGPIWPPPTESFLSRTRKPSTCASLPAISQRVDLSCRRRLPTATLGWRQTSPQQTPTRPTGFGHFDRQCEQSASMTSCQFRCLHLDASDHPARLPPGRVLMLETRQMYVQHEDAGSTMQKEA